VNECFQNVRRKAEREGGSIQFGWAIWTWPRVFIEAEHHAVYVPPDGQPWQDVTPAEDPETKRRLFLPDDTATYDFKNEGVRRDNVRMALSDDPLIPAFFAAAEERSRIWNSIPGVGKVQVPPAIAMKLQDAGFAVAGAMYPLATKYLQPNDPCFCGSGRRFKRCHG
jgi:hypothetical protein